MVATSGERIPVARTELAADDLRNALVAHVEDGGDIGHRHVFPVGLSDGLITLLTKFLGFGL
jgi:hypothetical protein